jgi:hypothetical protein
MRIERVFRNEGTVVLLEAVTDEGERMVIAADHRPAMAIAEALENKEEVRVEVEPWQVLGPLASQRKESRDE